VYNLTQEWGLMWFGKGEEKRRLLCLKFSDGYKYRWIKRGEGQYSCFFGAEKTELSVQHHEVSGE